MNSPEVGIIFPCRDIAANSKDLLDFAPAAERIGFDFLVGYDHVLGVHPDRQNSTAGIPRDFTSEHYAHEPMVLFGAMAALTQKIRLVTGVLVPAQRPTPLVAKQAAQVDILSDGRLELGIGVGWNEPEFEAMGYEFSGRAQRLEEQVSAMRELWTTDKARGGTTIEDIKDTNILPLPVQRPIPIWIGGLAVPAITRAAKIADGWLPLGYIGEEMEQKIRHYKDKAAEYGTENVRIMGRVNPWHDSQDAALRQFDRWVQNGATHIAIGTSLGCYRAGEKYFNEAQEFMDALKI